MIRGSMSAFNLPENRSNFSVNPFSMRPPAIERPLESDHSSYSSTGCICKRSGFKSCLSCSDRSSFTETSQEPYSAKVSDVRSFEANAKALLAIIKASSNVPSNVNPAAGTLFALSNDATSKNNNVLACKPGCKKNRSYASVVSTEVTAKAKPSDPAVIKKPWSMLDINKMPEQPS
ncbi:uncharacterized protein EV154DRAFT_594383 [Mucor mucedo]|uniref:uncharacterized protein n=1 Tax=Mucor mucedo TaxID=29922 RepID=UPI00221FA23A|nr:uncharacterized protein EV154DRAFT_594383 [Mucor mucedo]KAI7895752.1 hypothetical protein EV154DRAFT_594383 [Mucor mucedo]